MGPRCFLSDVNTGAVNDHVLSEYSVTAHIHFFNSWGGLIIRRAKRLVLIRVVSRVFLGVSSSVSINDDVLSEVGFTSEIMDVWWGWLVNEPVVVWWIFNWVAGVNVIEVHAIGLEPVQVVGFLSISVHFSAVVSILQQT